jgi:ribosomal protein S18 acetylase RimI-like enzyme
MATETLDRIERYYDAVPRHGVRVEDFGPLTLFVREGAGWPFYGRPTLGWSGPPATAADVRRVLGRQRELDLPVAFEWVAENTPGLRAAVAQAGLAVHAYPLLVLDPSAEVADRPPAGVAVRILAADDPALPAALTVADLAFGEMGTHVGRTGREQLAEAVRAGVGARWLPYLRERLRAGLSVVAAAVDGTGTVLAAGQHQPVDGVSEVVGVGTLPAARRRGLGLALTAALVKHARAAGVETVFLSATDDEVARVYRRAGFRPVGTALTAG